MSSYQKELEKYRDIDEDEILRTLSPEELEQLDCELQEMDPEVGARGPGHPFMWEGVNAGWFRVGSEGGHQHRAKAFLRIWEGVMLGGWEQGLKPPKDQGLCVLICSPKLIPKNMLLPAGLRQRDQTKKSPTGPLDRDALLQYLEQQALEVKERDDLVPFTGEKKGMDTLTSMSPRNQLAVSCASLLATLPASSSCQGLWSWTACMLICSLQFFDY